MVGVFCVHVGTLSSNARYGDVVMFRHLTRKVYAVPVSISTYSLCVRRRRTLPAFHVTACLDTMQAYGLIIHLFRVMAAGDVVRRGRDTHRDTWYEM